MSTTEQREGVTLTNLDQPLFDGADATKRDLVDYLDTVSDRIIPVLEQRPLSVVRVRPGQAPFMQKNVPKYAPEWLKTVDIWSHSSHRSVSYALCNDRPTLIWFANQRAVEYHPTLVRGESDEQTHLVIDLDPPEGSDFSHVVAVAKLVREAMNECGLSGAIKTSGSKGLHIFIPVTGLALDDGAAVTRALAERAAKLDPEIATTEFIKADRGNRVFVDSTRVGGATVVATYSPRIRPGTTVSYPLTWEVLDDVHPRDFTIKTAPGLLGDADPWAEHMPEPQQISSDLIAEGHTIPVARVAAMHEGKRRKRSGS
ncbi:MAG: ATP-dependent DNA ligase [Nocardiaceae bacterium]|nr:ATP-dependent DNA ligase [Nocardiaceae bacterium]